MESLNKKSPVINKLTVNHSPKIHRHHSSWICMFDAWKKMKKSPLHGGWLHGDFHPMGSQFVKKHTKQQTNARRY